MRITTIAAAFLLLASIAPAQTDFVSTVLSTKPLGYWRLDGVGGASLVNSYSLTEVGAPNYTAAGGGSPIAGYPSNGALSLNGSNTAPQYAKTGLTGSIPGQGSIMAWVKLSQLPSVAGAFFYVAGESQNGNDFDVQFQNDNKLYLFTGSGENTSYLPDAAKLLNTWHLLTVTFVGGAQGSRTIYWDGAVAASYSGPVNTAVKVNPFSIGYSLVFGGRDFNGLIDEVAVWNRALSVGEVTAIHNASTAPLSPTILATVPSFLGNAGFSAGMYAEIYGSNFTDHARGWAGSDFIGLNAPTSLDGVSVTVNGKNAFVNYISPGQININVPDDPATGPVPVQVKSVSGTSNSFTIIRAAVSPALETIPQFFANQKQYVVALTPDYSSYIGYPNMVAGLKFVLAKPGDIITLYALGLGPTTPATPVGLIAPQLAPLASSYQVTIGGVQANVMFAGIVAGSVGLYQINVAIPAVASGDQAIQLTVGGVSNAQSLFIPIGQ